MRALRLAASAIILTGCPTGERDGSSSSSKSSTAPLAASGSCTLITQVRVFDGERVIERTSVLVRDGKIAEVPAAASAGCATTIDGAGKTLLPGLIDAHTHAHEDADIASALRYGVTTELDMFGDPRAKAELRAHARARPDLSDFFSAGAGVTSPGGHGTEYGGDPRTVDGPSGVGPFVDACVDEGSDYIKIIYTPESIRFRSISRETLQASVEAAHRRKLLAVVHIDALRAGQDAIEAGADGLMHLFRDTVPTQAFIDVAKARGTFIVPTLSVLGMRSGHPHGSTLARDAAFVSRLDPKNLSTLRTKPAPSPMAPSKSLLAESVGLLHVAGVPILAGTDAGNPTTAHGASLHGELELFVAAGLTPVDALASATSATARAFRLNDRGRIRAGLRADMVLIDGDPTRDILATRRISRVWRGGVGLPAMDGPPAAPAPARDR